MQLIAIQLSCDIVLKFGKDRNVIIVTSLEDQCSCGTANEHM